MGGETFQGGGGMLDLDWCNMEGFLEEVETFRVGVAGVGTFCHRNPMSKGKSEFMWEVGD